jgi:hypothetical protein
MCPNAQLIPDLTRMMGRQVKDSFGLEEAAPSTFPVLFPIHETIVTLAATSDSVGRIVRLATARAQQCLHTGKIFDG